MPFTPEDQQNLVDLYALDREQLRSDSLLKQILNDAERFDSEQGTQTVAKVQTLLAQIYDPGGLESQAIAAQANPFSSIRRGEEYWIQSEEDGAKGNALVAQISSIRRKITRLLESGGYRYSSYDYNSQYAGFLANAEVARAGRS